MFIVGYEEDGMSINIFHFSDHAVLVSYGHLSSQFGFLFYYIGLMQN